MMDINVLVREAAEAKAKMEAANKALREAKASARWTALEAVRTASSIEGARWIRAALDGVVEGNPKAVSADYLIGKMRYAWARKGKKAPEARIVDSKPTIIYVYVERPAPTDGELEFSWNIMSEKSRLTVYAVANAMSTFAIPDDGSAPEKGIFVRRSK